MGNEYSNVLAYVVGIAAVVIFCLALLPTIANNVQGVAYTNNMVNETISLATLRTAAGINATTNQTVTNNPITLGFRNSPECKNLNGVTVLALDGSALSSTNDYTFFADTGRIRFKSTAAVEQLNETNITLVSYTYCPSGYAADNSGSRGILILIIIFAAMGIALYAMWPMVGDSIKGLVGI